MREGLAGGEVADDGADEGDGEEDVQVAQHLLVGALPHALGQGAQVDGDAVLDHPEAGVCVSRLMGWWVYGMVGLFAGGYMVYGIVGLWVNGMWVDGRWVYGNMDMWAGR